MSRHHTQLIRSIFHDPPPHNLHWRDVESLLRHVGVVVEPISGARLRVTLDRHEDVLHRPHGDELDRQTVLHVRSFLGRVGVTPAAYEQRGQGPG
ncbi:MAG: type II toxin-antitoxin system HicA family toxin [Rubrivivax sp.]